MRTREEQAKSLRDSLCADYVSAPVHEAGYELAMRHIEEAERRAEQRVRAEIARDSERLDWLEREFILMALVKGPAPVAPDKKLDAVFTQTGGIPFRSAIAASREVG